jgi:DNA-binding response OmpR family regulator
MTAVKVLIVDDDTQVRMVLTRVLASRGYEICSAPDAVSAVSTARQEHPDLVVLDLGLPAGNGVVVLERLRNLTSTAVTPVIVITGGMVDHLTEETLRGFGCDRILTKPITSQSLLDAVDEALGTQRLTDDPHGPS